MPTIVLSQNPTVASFVADDPDDNDNIFGITDLITINFDLATDSPPVATKAQIDAIFSFSESLGTDYSGAWISPVQLEITILNPFNHADPQIGVTTVTILGGLNDVSGTFPAIAGPHGPLSGDFGIGSSDPFSGGVGGGFVWDSTLNSTCTNFIGGSGDGFDTAWVKNPDSCITFYGSVSDGFDLGLYSNPFACGFFNGDTADGYSSAIYQTPYECSMFFSSGTSDGFSFDSSGCVDITLPVVASQLNGKIEDDNGVLFWETIIEQNNMGFELQKSLDSYNWEIIEFVEGQNQNFTTKYQVVDSNIIEGVNYYRYLQFDFDGSFTYSNIVELFYQNQEDFLESLTVYPNPVSSTQVLKVKCFSEKDNFLTYKIIDAVGKTHLSSNQNINYGSNLFTINTSMLSKGIYFIIFTTQKEQKNVKIMVR